MKKWTVFVLTLFFLLNSTNLLAQPAKKSNTQQKAKETDMNKLLEEAMKQEGMSKEDQEEMRKMMKDIMPALQEQNNSTADYPEFSDNKKLVPVIKNAAALSKKALTQTEVAAYASQLYTKLMSKIAATESGLVKKIIAQTPKANDIGSAAVLAMLQGHPETAIALAIYAVKAEPSNLNWQNNMAALLTQYGFAEQALPLLLKLKNELPYNSTVLNNLASAWLNLGQADSALNSANAATRINRDHPEAPQTAGVIQQSKGVNPSNHYQQAMANAPNPFTQTIAKNAGSKASLKWDDIKKNLTIYEYFRYDWLRIPKLKNSVKSYQDDMSVKREYAKISDKIEEKIELMTEEIQKELDALSDKGEDAFASEMGKTALKGLSWMSKPATNVLEVLHAFQTQNQLALADSLVKIDTWRRNLEAEKDKRIRAIYKKIEDSKKASCDQYKSELDQLENNYLEEVNTRIHKLMVRHIQDYRQWLNAWITWSWYVSGNIKNVMLMQDLQFTHHLAGMYKQAAELLVALPEHCNVYTKEQEHSMFMPDIPNFTCPAVVSVPSGPDWQQLSADAKDFTKNVYNIAKAVNPVPNVTIAYGINQVAQPGIAPFVKTANGSVMPGGLNNLPDDGDAQQPAIPHTAPPQSHEQMSTRELARSIAAKELMTHMLSSDCKKVKTDRENFKEGMNRILILDRIATRMRRYSGTTIEYVTVDEPALQQEIPVIKKEVEQTGLQPTINSGVQAPGIFEFLKDLFK